MNNRDKKVKGVKVKRVGRTYSSNWELACKANCIDMDSVLTISAATDMFVSFNELVGCESDKWDKDCFEIVEEQKPVANSETSMHTARDTHETHNLPEAILKQATVLAKAYEDYKRELDIHEELVKRLVAKEK